MSQSREQTAGAAAQSEAALGSREYPPYFGDLYTRSGAVRFGLNFRDFSEILLEISSRYLPAGATKAEAAELHRSLRVEELALARACAAGSETAWECFVDQYRPKLYQMARGMTGDEYAARELADSLYTGLYGMRANDEGGRNSKLRHYTGRGSLEGWLRTVLAQEYVDRYRKTRRLVSFDESVAVAQTVNADQLPTDPRLERAVDAALAQLSGEERFILASSYLDGRTLAQIGRMMGVHESTVSRRLDKIVAGLRKRIVRALRDCGMSGKEAEQMMKTDVRDLALDIRGRLVQEKRG